MTEQNFNRAMATAADLVIAEVEEIVPLGALDPDTLHTPGCYVDYLVQAHVTPENLGTSASLSAAMAPAKLFRNAACR
jgi:3-oxoacid CoA-transferase